jgi:hypothetical protein
MNETGDFAIVWDPGDIICRRYDSDGVPLGSSFKVNTSAGGSFPSVAMRNSGDFVVTWTTRMVDGSVNGVAGQRYDNTGAQIGSEFQINTYTYLDQQNPAVEMDDEGKFAVVWESCQEDTVYSWAGWGIYGQQYDAAGAMSGDEMHVNTYTDERQDSPKIAMIDGEHFVIVWDSDPYNTLSDSLHAGIYGQLYGPEDVAVTFGNVVATYLNNSTRINWDIVADEPIKGFDIIRTQPGAAAERSVLDSGLLDGKARWYIDKDLRYGSTYYYTVVAVKRSGDEIRSQTVEVRVKASTMSLSQNYPNPFNPSTTIRFSLDRVEAVSLAIYDNAGRHVRTLVDRRMTPGPYQESWDGKNAAGQIVSSGMYFYRLKAGKKFLTKKMIFLK